MRRLLSLAAVLAIIAAPAVAADFRAGNYTAEGTNLDGSPYKGTAVVKLLSDTTCEIDWTTGSTTSVGLCMMMDGVVAAAYRQGDNVGVTMYHINDDGSLEGAWTVAGQNGSGTEKLTPQ
jgi:hypothetical protein